MPRWSWLLALALCASTAFCQSRLPSFPGWEQHTVKRPVLNQKVKLAELQTWWLDGDRFACRDGDEWVIQEAASGKETRQAERPSEIPAPRIRRPLGRGRQSSEEVSPDGSVRAVCRNRNVYLISKDGEKALTTEGSAEKRIKFGEASWVYGEELYQSDAMGFSPDGQKLWFYRFDESEVKDYFTIEANGTSQTEVAVEAYPKPGTPNPKVEIWIADVKSGAILKVDGGPHDGMGHYLYHIRWSPDGRALLFHRTDRPQQHMEFCRADPATGKVTVLDREANENGWVENFCPSLYLDEAAGIDRQPKYRGKVLWLSERSGWLNLYLLDLEKGGVTPITKNQFDVREIVQADLKDDKVWYMAASAPAGRRQLHWASLDGRRGGCVTDPAFDHRVDLAPGGKWLISRMQNAAAPPKIVLMDEKGRIVRVLKESETGALASLGYSPSSAFTYTSADGVTPLQGSIEYPASFDKTRRYPVIFQVYNGPLGCMADSWREGYRLPDSLTDFGFVVVSVESRGGGGRGRAFQDALYKKMGITEIDDIAAAARRVSELPFVDPDRIGIEGTSYGGYATLMAMVRYPDIFKAGAAQSSVSWWANYDSAYTERYMGLLPESEDAYTASAATGYAKDLKGWLMLYYGTADDNTHPANTLQMIRALQRAGRSFEVQVGVDVGHSGMDFRRLAEFFIERLAPPEKARPLP